LRVAACGGKEKADLRVLDLFCGAGGAAMGLHRAWPDAVILGVDIEPQPHYPFQFVQADWKRPNYDAFDFIWASPPCQGYSEATPLKYRAVLPKLISPVRKMLLQWDGPFVIENVENAKEHLWEPIMLCGSMFGLTVWRHRYFETHGFYFRVGHQCQHKGRPVTLHCGSNTRKSRKTTSVDAAGEAMGITWMTGKELNEAVPPAYSEYIARQFDLSRKAVHP
jgi:DNA (cytosine-5)-methyltransferase 1